MSINKYFRSLQLQDQYNILDICKTRQTTDNKVLSIYYVLFTDKVDYIHTDKRYEAICYYIYKYADRLNYYLTNGESFGQYLRSLDKKLGLLHFRRLL